MLALGLTLALLIPHLSEVWHDHGPTPKDLALWVKGRYLETKINHGMKGSEVARLLGAPTTISIMNVQSGGTWHYCYLTYDDLSLFVVLYAENQFIWPSILEPRVPESWQVRHVRMLRPNEPWRTVTRE